MPIEIQEEARTFTPVVKRQRIGDRFIGAVIRYEQRDVRKRGDDGVDRPVLKPNGKPKQELVVHCLALPGTTSVAGIGDQIAVPAPGDTVRLILRGRAFGDWIESRKTHRNGKSLRVGDVVEQVVDHAQAYDANGAPKGNKITSQADVDRIPRGTSLGFYGPLTLAEPTDQAWVARAEAAYNEATAIDLDGGDDGADEEPF